MSLNKEEQIDILNTKHTNAMDLIDLKGKQNCKAHKNKMDYSTYLYGLKNKYVDKTHKQTLVRIKYAFGLRNKR